LIPADPASKSLHFELHGDPREIVPGVEDIETFLRDAGCNAASVGQLAVVAEEILANIVRDAWAGREPGHCAVDLRAAAKPDGIHVSLRTEDDGIAFDPIAAESPDVEASLDERAIGGLGILLIRTMTDRQVYHRVDGRNIFEVFKVCPLAQADC
jgi:serine/threonine-protein kinase RsbW